MILTVKNTPQEIPSQYCRPSHAKEYATTSAIPVFNAA